MTNGKKTFIFYSDWTNMIKEMPDKDAGQLLKHILSYVNDEDPTSDNLLVKMAFGHMKPLLKSDLEKWEKQLEKYSDMGKKSAETRANNKVEPRLTQVKPTSTVNVNVNDNVKIQEKEQWFIDWFNSSMKELRGSGRFKLNSKIKKQLHDRIKEGYISKDFINAFNAIKNDNFHKEKHYMHLTPEFITRVDKLEMWCNAERPEVKINNSHLYIT